MTFSLQTRRRHCFRRRVFEKRSRNLIQLYVLRDNFVKFEQCYHCYENLKNFAILKEFKTRRVI